MKTFKITARTTSGHCIRYTAIAASSMDAALDAVELFGDTPCGITVTASRIQS